MNDKDFEVLQEKKLQNQEKLIGGINAVNLVLVKIDTKIDAQGKTLQDIRKFTRTANKETGILAEKVELMREDKKEGDQMYHKQTKWMLRIIVIGLLIAGGINIGSTILQLIF